MSGLLLVEIGSLPEALVERVGALVARVLPLRLHVHPTPLSPDPSFNAVRGQYDSRLLLAMLEGLSPLYRVVGLTEVDIFSSVFAYVFGEARLGGRAAIVSAYRLDPRIYGLAADSELLEARLAKETLHEVGHLLGLVHCRDSECVMYPSTDPSEVDFKPASFCVACRGAISGRE